MRFPDDHDLRKYHIESEMIAGRNPLRIMSELRPENELRGNLCEALGWIRGPQGWQRTEESWPSALPPLDHNLIAVAREKLLTTDDLRRAYVRSLCDYVPELASNLSRSTLLHLEWALTQSTPIQQARAILEAVKV